MAAAKISLLDYWRGRLSESQKRLAAAPKHRRWIWRSYVKIYQFLLSSYREQAERGDLPFHESPAPDPSNGKSVGLRDSLEGAAPKSAEQIRSTLNAVHDAVGESIPPSGASSGLSDETWITVALTSKPAILSEIIKNNGVETRLVFHGDRESIEVRRVDFERTRQIIFDNKEKTRKLESKQDPGFKIYLFDFLVSFWLGALFTAIISFIIIELQIVPAGVAIEFGPASAIGLWLFITLAVPLLHSCIHFFYRRASKRFRVKIKKN